MGEGLGGRNLKPNSEALSLEAGTERMKALMSGTHGIPSGGGGCAAHVPPRCRGRKKSLSEFRYGFPAEIRAPCKAGGRMSKFFPKTRRDAPKWSPKWSQNPTQIDEKSSPSPSWAAVGSQEGPKSTKDVPKMRPRGGQEHPRAPQERPRAAQETPGRRPNQAKISPGALQDLSVMRS